MNAATLAAVTGLCVDVMSAATLAAVTGLCVISTGLGAAQIAQGPIDAPWNLLVPGAATTAVIVTSWMFLRELREQRVSAAANSAAQTAMYTQMLKEAAAVSEQARTESRKDFIDALDRITSEFGSKMDASHVRVEQALRSLVDRMNGK